MSAEIELGSRARASARRRRNLPTRQAGAGSRCRPGRDGRRLKIGVVSCSIACRSSIRFSVSFFKPLAQCSRRGQKSGAIAGSENVQTFHRRKIHPERERPGRGGGERRGDHGQLRARFAQGFSRRGRGGAQGAWPAGRNKALICAARFCIAPPRCWKCAGRNWKRKWRGREQAQRESVRRKRSSRSSGSSITRAGRTNSARFSAR